jgi:NAD+ kinase
MKIIGLISNNKNIRAIKVAKEIYDYLLERNMEVSLLADDSMPIKYELPAVPAGELSEKADTVISVGGDGTFLRAARYCFKRQVPIMGVNVGKLGFLAETEKKDFKKSVDALLKGNYRIENRMLIGMTVIRKDKVLNLPAKPFIALNEFVISRILTGKILDFELVANGYKFFDFRSDGIIIATPTGSTAYSLSAGGPVVEPLNRSIIVTPLSAHSLFSRSMVFSTQSSLRVVLKTKNKHDHLSADGVKMDLGLCSGDQFEIRESELNLKIITLGSNTFFKVFRQKLLK